MIADRERCVRRTCLVLIQCRAPVRPGFVLFPVLLAGGLLLSAALLSWTALHGARPRAGIGDPLVGRSPREDTTCRTWGTPHA